MLTIRELIKTLNNAFNQKLKKNRGNWEQNDPTADDYIKNRPFYIDGNTVKKLDSKYFDIEIPETVGIKGTGDNAEVFNGYPAEHASGDYSHAEGSHTEASGDYSHAEGSHTEASGDYSHAEGYCATASGEYSHAEGYDATASGLTSHAEGWKTIASGDYSHAEGYETNAPAWYSHAEGANTTASGLTSHAEGSHTEASGQYSHAEGFWTIAASDHQHVQGKYNIKDATNKYAHIVGNGSLSTARSNAHTLDWDGNGWFAGTVEGTAMIVKSSTSGSAKRFKITVDDSGTITATEVTA